MVEFLERLIDEKNQLEKRYTNLESFLNTDTFYELDIRQQGLLQIQVSVMAAYLRVLNERIALL